MKQNYMYGHWGGPLRKGSGEHVSRKRGNKGLDGHLRGPDSWGKESLDSPISKK